MILLVAQWLGFGREKADLATAFPPGLCMSYTEYADGEGLKAEGRDCAEPHSHVVVLCAEQHDESFELPMASARVCLRAAATPLPSS
jgi:hypothetical protein